MIGAPPSAPSPAGALQATASRLPAGWSVGAAGAFGTVRGLSETTSELALAPAALWARTRKWYSVPLLRPEISCDRAVASVVVTMRGAAEKVVSVSYSTV